MNSSLSDRWEVVRKGVGGHVVDQARGPDIVEGLAWMIPPIRAYYKLNLAEGLGNSTKSSFYQVGSIADSRILIFFHPGSMIPDLGYQTDIFESLWKYVG